MSQTIQMGEFFVVGGPVQPDRQCYLERAADAELIRALAEGEFCYVLAPQALGKTSLMGHAVRILREQGQAAALVDLTQVGAREPSSDPARWFYSIAYRIVRELRLKLELQSWWQENSILAPEQRLAEFFRDIVLGNTRTPVTIFFDELERTLELPFAKDFFGEIRASYNARTTEPEFDRLNFVLLGASSPARLCPDPDLSPFSMGRAIELDDFGFPETLGLAPGFGIDIEHATGLLKRVHHWTQGQPYLTQKLARAVARRAGGQVGAADVDQLVQERFLNPAAAKDEPHFNSIRARLTQAKRSRQSLSTLGQVAKGDEVEADFGSAAQENLYLAGLVKGLDGRLTMRNRIYAHVFSAGWVNSVLPFDMKVFGSALAAAALVILLPVWYSQVLPQPYIATLSSATQDLAVAREAYSRLERLPGFSGTADRLFAEVLTRRSRQAVSFAQWREADTLLGELDDQANLAQMLEGEFWFRQARAATAQQDRDRALIFALKANENGKTEGLGLAATLISSDYPNLAATLRFQGDSGIWDLDPRSGTVAVVDDRLRVGHLGVSAAEFEWSQPLRARQFVPLERTQTITEESTRGSVSLQLDFSTSVPEGLSAMLTDPRGQQQTVAVALREGPGAESLSFGDLTPGGGSWRLDIVDSAADGRRASITRWCVAWGGACRGEETSDPVQVPEPIATDDVDIALFADRSLAIALPRRMPAGGSGVVWDYDRNQELGDFALAEPPLAAVLLGTRAEQVFLAEPRRWGVYSLATKEWLWRRAGLLSAVPALDSDRRHALTEEVDARGRRSLAFTALESGREVARLPIVPGTLRWALLPGASHVALGTDRTVELVELETGAVLARRVASAPIAAMVAAGESIVVVDESGSILQWSGLPESLERQHWLGRTTQPASLELSRDGRFVSFQEQPGGSTVVRDLQRMTSGDRVRHPTALETEARIDPLNELIVTHSPGELRLWRMRQGLPAAPADGLTQRLLASASGPLLIADAAGQVRAIPVENNRVAPVPQIGFVGHGARVTALAAAESVDLFASGDEAGAVRLWSLATGDPNSIPLRHAQGPVRALAVGGSWVASGAELVVNVWRTDTGAPATEIPVADGATALAFSVDATLLAVGDGGGNILLTAPEADSPLRALRGQARVTALAFSPSGQRLAAGDQEGRVYLFDPLTGEYVAEPLTLGQSVDWLAYSDLGELIARSGDWLHWLVLSPEQQLVSARQALLPAEAAGVAAVAEDGTVRVPTGGGLRLEVSSFQGGAEAQSASASTEGADQWLRRLALAFDEEAGTVRIPTTESVN